MAFGNHRYGGAGKHRAIGDCRPEKIVYRFVEFIDPEPEKGPAPDRHIHRRKNLYGRGIATGRV